MSAVAAALALLVLLPGPAGRAAKEARGWRPPELRVHKKRLDRFDELKDIAFSYLGRPYSLGGIGSPAFDCSGYVCRVYAEAGYPLPRVSRDQVRVGRQIPIDAIQPGDLLFFAEGSAPISHVGIYLGDGEMAHASSGRGEVTVADLDNSWFQERLVAARRVLTSTITEIAPREMVEHAELLPMLRRPPRLPPPSFGPELTGRGETSIGLRSMLLTERGILGLTLVPEATLTIESIALSLAVAVPIRFELHQSPTVGTFERPRDYLRFVREISLGLPRADLELSFARLGDHQLAGGFLVRRFAPGTVSNGITGLAVETSPLTFYGAWRTDWFRVESLIDDVLDPSFAGTSAMVPLFDLLEIGAAYATDQGGARAINAIEADVIVHAYERKAFSLDIALDGAVVRALGESGGGGRLSVDGEYRFSRYDSAINLALRAGWLGPRALMNLFGPTYPIAREEHLEALDRVRGRPIVGGELTLRLGRATVGAVFESGVGANRDPLDQIVEGLVAIDGIRLGGTRFLDLRAAYASRSLFRDEPTVDVLHGSARLRLYSWLFLELYVKKAGTFEGGGGVTIMWIP